MSILSKIGTVLRTVAIIGSDLAGFPFIAQLIGSIPGKAGQVTATVYSDFNSVAQVISMVEAGLPEINGVKTGSQKLAIAAPIVQQIILTWAASNLPGHNKVKDPTKLAAAAAGIASNFADAMNSFGD